MTTPRQTRPRAGAGTILLTIVGSVAGVVATQFASRMIHPGDSDEPLQAASTALAGHAGSAVDDSMTLEEVAGDVGACVARAGESPGCAGVVYVWSPRMPLSRAGMSEIAAATQSLGISLHVVHSSELRERTPSAEPGPADELARRMISAGATLHEPAVVVHRGGEPMGGAILGYKAADAYRSLIEERLAAARGELNAPTVTTNALQAGAASLPSGAQSIDAPSFTDLPARGQPGAYFRWVPARNAVAYESGGVVYLLDLESGESRAAPGNVDFVPTPDGRFFVTPGRSRSLEFYDAPEVFMAASAGRGREVRPFYVDGQMQDQYPSVGILSTEQGAQGSRTVYRILTSWYDRVAYRDYEVRLPTTGGRATVRPLAPPVDACAGYRFSIPIMSQTGLEVAGRDEATGTTKILRFAPNGRCTEVADIGLPTGKVAWSPDGQRLAFAIPQGAVSDGRGVLFMGDDDASRAGVFVYDRQTRAVTKVEASEQNRRLTFPEFVGNDRVTFLLPGERAGQPNRFRLVCCLR